MNDLFSDHFNNPRNVGMITDAHGAGQAGDPGCGVVIEFFLRFDHNRVDAASYKATGSSAAIACGSLLTELAAGENWRQVASISEKKLTLLLETGEEPKPALNIAAGFAIEALHSALEDSIRRKTFPVTDQHAESVLVAMSGGVDSSVASLLVRDSGRETMGVTMRLWSDPECAETGAPTCCSPQAIRDARAVCHALGLPHLTVDYTEDFARTVVDPFVDGYLDGFTPNPCTQCNGSFRFPALVGLADYLGASKVATGHYALLVTVDEQLHIARAADGTKDQSYMLWGIDPGLLARLEFPLGDIRKDETRRIAREAGMTVHDRAESQEVCFIPDDDYRRFIRSRAAVTGKGSLLPGEGEIVDADGARIGLHHGFIDFTVGQRHGLGVSAPEPLYVLKTDPETNQVVAGGRKKLAVRYLTVSGINPGHPHAGNNLVVQVRYNSSPAAVKALEAAGEGWRIELEEPVSGVAPGQSAVLYEDGVILAGGVIQTTG
ncbi:MAG: tRNA 2-thiouridine(34) synthase MnmA [Thermoleophilia bacterium]|nr:tRNA 2-thiouridine(34) synthase MnmA [Thermoleophilia bacterium]